MHVRKEKISERNKKYKEYESVSITRTCMRRIRRLQ